MTVTGTAAGLPARVVRAAGLVAGLVVVALAIPVLVSAADGAVLADVAGRVLDAPVALAAALACYAAAFGLRVAAWRRVLPGLSRGQAWAALHVALLGNHVLPLRLGEALRVTSVLRRTDLPPPAVAASAVALRAGDVLAVLLLAAVAGPRLLLEAAHSAPTAAGIVGTAAVLVMAVALATLVGLRRAGGAAGVALRLPGPAVAAATLVAWLLEAVVVATVARAAGVELDPGAAVAVTAVTIAAQTIAITPGGFGSYEAAGTAALVGLGVPAGTALAIALATHGVKTFYALLAGIVGLVVPAPPYAVVLRLPALTAPRPTPWPVPPDAPVVAVIPVHDEQDTIAGVVAGLPAQVRGRRVLAVVVDDGSTDDSARRAREAGAEVVAHGRNRGLGAAVRTGLAAALRHGPAAVVYLDADLEYDPGELTTVAAPVLDGTADYVVGSRFAGRIERMLAHRRLGNRVLTGWVRFLARRRDLTDGQSGYRAFSARAAAEAEIVHDYNYAQVLTLDLLGKGFRHAEVPIGYAFRTHGRSFVRLGHYLRHVVPAVHRELAAPHTLRYPHPHPPHPHPHPCGDHAIHHQSGRDQAIHHAVGL